MQVPNTEKICVKPTIAQGEEQAFLFRPVLIPEHPHTLKGYRNITCREADAEVLFNGQESPGGKGM